MTPTAPAETLLDEVGIQSALVQISQAIVDRHDSTPLAIVGLLSQGDVLADRLTQLVRDLGHEAVSGSIDISLYRDDIFKLEAKPSLRSSNLPFSTDEMRVILVDDVMNTGRTIRAALNAIFDYGRPAKVELACLVDRGQREVPIQPNYVGYTLTKPASDVVVHLKEKDGIDSVTLYPQA